VDSIEAFYTLAEVSITFTGLAGIVSVVGRSSFAPEARHWRVWNMILLSLLAFFLSLTPIALSLFSLSSNLTWTTSSLILVAAQISQSLFASRAGNSIGSASEYTIRPLLFIYFTGSGVTAILQVLNVFVFTPGPGPFFVGICWIMFLAALHFFVLVINIDLNKEAT